jgi:hypothetical protein
MLDLKHLLMHSLAPPVIIELFDSLLLPEEKSFDDLFVSFHGNLDDRLVQIKF